jgi:hypothetical protein
MEGVGSSPTEGRLQEGNIVAELKRGVGTRLPYGRCPKNVGESAVRELVR